jgi:hypothetical protein
MGSRAKPLAEFLRDYSMAQCEHLPIYRAAFDLQIYFEGIVKNSAAGFSLWKFPWGSTPPSLVACMGNSEF